MLFVRHDSLAKGSRRVITILRLSSSAQSRVRAVEPGKDVVLGLLPFGHIYGLTVILVRPLFRQSPTKLTWAAPDSVYRTAGGDPAAVRGNCVLDRHPAVQGYLDLVVPPVLIVLLNSPNVAKYDLSSLKGMMCGAAPLGADWPIRFQEQFKPVLLTQG